jgi:hypothetical protein
MLLDLFFGRGLTRGSSSSGSNSVSRGGAGRGRRARVARVQWILSKEVLSVAQGHKRRTEEKGQCGVWCVSGLGDTLTLVTGKGRGGEEGWVRRANCRVADSNTIPACRRRMRDP